MFRKSVGLGVAVAALAGGTFFVAGSSGKTRPHGTLSLFEHDTSQAQLDLGETGTGPGDQFVFAGDLFDRKGGTKLGRLGGYCTTVSPTETFCTSSFVLKGGQITSQGMANSAALFGGKTLGVPITGGTGIYRNARGYGTVRIPQGVPNLTDAYFVLHSR
jgi:hypothetical protein